MKTLMIAVLLVLVVAFVADGAFKTIDTFKQHHERTQETLRKMT